MYYRMDSKKLPYFETKLQQQLYSTLMSYQSVNKINNYQINANHSGSFSELIHGPLSGQISYLSIGPLGIRGNHYHHSKIEKFFILDGTLEWRETDIRWPKATHRKVVKTGDTFYTIPGVNHSIKNQDPNKTARIIIWASEIYDDQNEDTFKIEKLL
jgi:UDP-2-acetamido-2,6-beta-L-arabino-hexul-4-ose reductase